MTDAPTMRVRECEFVDGLLELNDRGGCSAVGLTIQRQSTSDRRAWEKRENGIFPGIRLTILYATAIPATTAKADHRTELEIAAESKQRLDEPQA